MNIKKYAQHIILGVAVCTISISASAILGGGIVYDPTNWIQNNSTALAGMRTEINTARTLIQETQTAINMAKSVKGMANLDSLTQANEALKLYKELQTVDGRLEKDFQQSSELTDRVTTKYGASSMSWDEYMSSRDQIDKQQRDTSAQRYRAINASMEQTSRQRQAIVGQLATVQGQTEAMQTLGASIDVLIGQNQQIISILTSNQRIAETKQELQVTDEKKSADDAAKLLNARQQRLRQAADKY
jgi:conjugal transfer/entry exclusion protein